MKKNVILTLLFVATMTLAAKDSDFLNLASEADFPVKLSSETATYLNQNN
jgi:hypothetical protein